MDARDSDDAAGSLTLLEARVLQLAWQGKKQVEIAQQIARSPRSVSRILKHIAAKLGPLDPALLRLRLEDELLARIPTLTDSALIAALRLYRPLTTTDASPASSTSNRDVQQLLRKVMTRDDTASTGA